MPRLPNYKARKGLHGMVIADSRFPGAAESEITKAQRRKANLQPLSVRVRGLMQDHGVHSPIPGWERAFAAETTTGRPLAKYRHTDITPKQNSDDRLREKNTDIATKYRQRLRETVVGASESPLQGLVPDAIVARHRQSQANGW